MESNKWQILSERFLGRRRGKWQFTAVWYRARRLHSASVNGTSSSTSHQSLGHRRERLHRLFFPWNGTYLQPTQTDVQQFRQILQIERSSLHLEISKTLTKSQLWWFRGTITNRWWWFRSHLDRQTQDLNLDYQLQWGRECPQLLSPTANMVREGWTQPVCSNDPKVTGKTRGCGKDRTLTWS